MKADADMIEDLNEKIMELRKKLSTTERILEREIEWSAKYRDQLESLKRMYDLEKEVNK